jgi:hypothetical protein
LADVRARKGQVRESRKDSITITMSQPTIPYRPPAGTVHQSQAKPTTSVNANGIPGFTTTIRGGNLITAATFGKQRRGKTHFSLTASLVPQFAPIGVIPLDKNTLDVVEKFVLENPDADGQILLPEKDFIKGQSKDLKAFMAMSKENKEAAVLRHRTLCDEIKTLYWTLNDSPPSLVKTIAIDATQLWSYIMFANYGRALRVDPIDRGVANQELVDMINASRKHLILVHDASEIWTTQKDPRGNETKGPSGNDKPDGCSKILPRVNVVVEHFKRKTPKTRDGGGELVFGARVSDSTLRPDLIGDQEAELIGEDCNWMSLVGLLKPELLLG